METKKIKYMIILSVVIIISGIVLTFTQTKINSLTKMGSNDEYMLYKLDNIKKKNKKANVIIRYDDEGKTIDEFKVKQNDVISAFKMGVHEIKFVKIEDDYITISLDDLAPTKKNGTFSMTKKYKNVTIKKNTGLQLNIQATDLYKGYIYLFYLSN